MRKLTIWRKYIRMGDYGSETEKGTWLYSGRTVVKVVKYLCATNTPSQQNVYRNKAFLANVLAKHNWLVLVSFICVHICYI